MAAVVLLAVFFFFFRRGGGDAPAGDAALLGRGVASDTREIRYVESRDGRPLFTVTARKNVATRGGVNDLEGVTAVYYGWQGERRDVIEGDSCRYSATENTVRFQGNVRVHSGGYTLETTRVDYDKAGEQVTSETEFRLAAEGLTGRGRGFRIDLAKRTFRLIHPLELRYQFPGETRDRPEGREGFLDVAAGSGWILDEGATVRLEDGVILRSVLSRLSGAEMTIRLDPKRRVREAAAEGAAVFARRDPAGELELSGDAIVFRIAPEGDRLESASADGRARLVLQGDALAAERIRIEADPSGRVAAVQGSGGSRFTAARTGQEMTGEILRLVFRSPMQPEALQLAGNAGIAQRTDRGATQLAAGHIRIDFQAAAAGPAPARIAALERGRVTVLNAAGDEYRAEADELTVRYDAEGRFPLLAAGRGTCDCRLQRRTPKETTTVQADRFQVAFFAGSADAQSFDAEGNVRLRRESDDGRWSEATGRTLTGSMRPRERNRVDALALKGSVTYQDPKRRGRAAEASLKDDLLKLRGDPQFEEGGAVTRAETFVYDVARRVLSGQGLVETTIVPGTPGAALDMSPLGNGGGKAEPVYLHANGLEGDEAAGRLVYRGQCRMVQGRNILTAGQFEIDQASRRFNARDKVRGIFFTRDGKGKEQRFEITADRMQYDPDRRDIRFEGQVRSRTEVGTLDAERLDGRLREGGGLNALTARGAVRLNQPGREASGDQLTLDVASGVYVLTGAPAVVVDRAEGRTTRGTQLTFSRGDDRIRVDSGPQSIKKE
jgi:lipopolysaccharide export system protein LptA